MIHIIDDMIIYIILCVKSHHSKCWGIRGSFITGRNMSITPGKITGTTKTQATYLAIRNAIEQGEYPAGMQLRLSALVEQFGISPTPIREALRMLQSEGLVTNSPHRGMRVTTFTQEAVEEFYQLRELLEPYGAQLAALKSTEADLDKLRKINTAIAESSMHQREAEAAALNLQWHETLVSAAHSKLLTEFCGRIYNILPLTNLWLGSCAHLSIKEHDAVLEAIEAKEPEEARKAMAAHLARGHKQALNRVAESCEDGDC